MAQSTKILVVDDEEFNLDILSELLSADGYTIIQGKDGIDAIEQLQAHPDIDLIILDRMMPRMDGMETIQKIKSMPALSRVPIIMQTAASSSAQIQQGIEAGVYYYLTKPYEESMLLGIVHAALYDARSSKALLAELNNRKRVLGLMENASFRFRTLEEAKNLAYFISFCFPDPERTVYGLCELMINAIEHGNLGISYEEKKQLILQDGWLGEVNRRLSLPENIHKYATLEYAIRDGLIALTIKDQGKGFDWRQYMDLDPHRILDPNGRGIATSRLKSFDALDYRGNGSEVICTVRFNSP